MALQLENLDGRTRRYMLDEFDDDIEREKLYLSERLTQRGEAEYPRLLREAIEGGDDTTLARAIREAGLIRRTERKRKPKGGFTTAKVPRNAPETLAEGEFNRFYIRGLCRRALEDGISELEIYRAKRVLRPRPESERKIGRRVSAETLLSDLQRNIGVDTALGIPAGPNSGLSVRLPEGDPDANHG